MRRRQGCLLVATLVLTGLVAMPTPASASPELDAAEQTLIAIQQRSSSIDEQYTRLSEDLAAAQQRLAAANRSLVDHTTDLARLRPLVAQLALASYQQPLGPMWVVSKLLTAPDPDAFLDQLSTVQQFTDKNASLLADYEAQASAAADIRAQALAEEAGIARDKALLEEAQRALEAQMVSARQVLDKLTAEQKAQLMARRTASRATANRPASPSLVAPTVSPTASASPTPTPTLATPSVSPTPTATPSASASASSPAPPGGSGTPSKAALQALAFATAQLGDAYVMGATGPDAWDCSGLTLKAFNSVGIALPRIASEQAKVGTPVALKDLIPGDLVFYYSPITHVGIYAGDGMIVNAESPILGVVEVSVTWMPFTTGRRVV